MNVSARSKKEIKAVVDFFQAGFLSYAARAHCLELVVDFEESIVEDFAAGKLGITKITDCFKHGLDCLRSIDYLRKENPRSLARVL